MINVDVVIPTYSGYSDIKDLVNSFKQQQKVNIKNIVIPITKSSFGNDYNLINFCKNNRIKYFFIEKENFSHSLIREKAINDFCENDVVILLTQDAKLCDSLAMYNLVKDIESGDVVYTFGRQICSKEKCIERYIREYNYPSESYVSSKDKIEKYKIKSFFASDVFAGINRKVFIKLNGYKNIDVSTNEDMLYMYNLLHAGYKAKYCANAAVYHYHSYNIKTLYKRYYEIGKFFKKTKIFNEYNKNNAGMKLSFYVLKRAFRNFDIISIVFWLPNMLARYIGMKRGFNE